MIREALLIGRAYGLAWTLPHMLARAGFTVDAITSSPLLKKAAFLRHCRLVSLSASLIPFIRQAIQKPYDWIIVTDDDTLGEILRSDLSLEERLKVLPVQSTEHFSHLYSKIGLSKVLAAGQILSPPSLVARHRGEVLLQANELGYPILVKVDASGGGAGVVECRTPVEVDQLDEKMFAQPVLVQKKIGGFEIDLSALYFEGKLIHFNYATVKRIYMNPFGPSVLRTYFPMSRVEQLVFEELQQIGTALGAHGFTNIGAIQAGNRRYYFEVDMRPNVWIEMPRYLGEDPALRVQRWFSEKQTLSFPVPSLPDQPTQKVIPYFLRLERRELLCNRYRVWEFIPKDDPKLVFWILFHRIFSSSTIVTVLKRILPPRLYAHVRKLKYYLCRV